jgi:hypothetical protein
MTTEQTGSIILRRGPTVDRLAFVPLDGEIIYDSELQKVYIGDNITYGGVAITASAAAIPNVYYVTKSGKDTNSGATIDQAFASIKQACQAAGAGHSNLKATNLITSNISWLVEEMYQWMLYQKSQTISPFSPSSVFDQTATRRDATTIVNAIAYDLTRTGNFRIIASTLAYFNQSTFTTFYNTSTAAAMPYIIPALTYLKSLILSVMNNTAPAQNYQNLNSVANPILQTFNLANPAESTAASYVTGLFNIVLTALSGQTITGIPSINAGILSSIYVKVGTYDEQLPIVVPENCNILGDSIHDVFIQPAAGLSDDGVTPNNRSKMFLMSDGTLLKTVTMQGLTGYVTNVASPTDVTVATIGGIYIAFNPASPIISKSPYIIECSSFSSGGIGAKVDGGVHVPGNKSMLFSQYTNLHDLGVGFWINGDGKAEIVSCFAYYCQIGYVASDGGTIRSLNGNCSYGTYGAVSIDYNVNETPVVGSLYGNQLTYNKNALVGTFSAGDTIVGATSAAQGTIIVTSVLYSIIIYSSISGTFQAGESISNGTGSSVTIATGGVTGQNGNILSIATSPATLPVAGGTLYFTSGSDTNSYTIQTVGSYNPATGRAIVTLSNATFVASNNGTTFAIRYLFSVVRLTGHDFLNIGTGGKVTSNYPGTPTQPPAEGNQTIAVGLGRIYYVTTDQDGNLRIGTFFRVQQSTGIITLNTSAFNLAGLNTLNVAALGGIIGQTINQFSADDTLSGASNTAVPTQYAVKNYLTHVTTNVSPYDSTYDLGDSSHKWNNIFVKTVNVDSNIVFEGATDNAFETTLTAVDPTADRTITLPNVSGTVVTTGDSGTVTSTMIADGTIVNADVSATAAIVYSKLSLGTSIVNADISATAAIAYSKLSLGTSIVNGDISATAAIAYSKLSLGTSIVNSDVSATAAIAYSKLSLGTSIVNGDISTTAAIAVSKLASSTISGVTLGNNLNTLTIGTGLSGTSYNGSAAITISIDSTVVTKAGAQTLTNKTFEDLTTYFADDVDSTKKFQFQVNGVTASTTRTLVIPDRDGTIITSGDTGTVTNAMLGGSITNDKLTNSKITLNGNDVSLGGSLTITANAPNAMTIGDGLSGTSYNGNSAVTIAVDATVVRTSGALTIDGVKTFSSTIGGSISGNSATATKLATGRTIAITGDISYTSPTFDGSGSVTAAATLPNANTSGAGTYTSVTVNAKGLVTSAGQGTTYVGTTSIALNRTSAAQSLTGINGLTAGASAFTLQAATAANGSGYALNIWGANAGTNSAGGLIDISAGAGDGTGGGGKVTIAGGTPGLTSTGGNVQLLGGGGADYGGTTITAYGYNGSDTGDEHGGYIEIFAGKGRGTNIPGGYVDIKGGSGTGTGIGGAIRFYTAPVGTTGTAVNGVVKRMDILTNGRVGMDANIASTTTGTGTLVVTGGVGVSGAVYAGSLYDTGNRVVTGTPWTSVGYITGNQSISLTGDVTGTGTTAITTTISTDAVITTNIKDANVTSAKLADSGVTAGTYNNVTVSLKGIVTGGSNTAYVTGTPWTSVGYLTAIPDPLTVTELKTNILTGNNAGAGIIKGTWTLNAGARFEATYADLAEKYVADAEYEPGTVLELGGEFEVTTATLNSRKIAGVVSTNPSYVLNKDCQGEHVVVMALQGRVPCKVRGKINKGDLLVSCGDGYACPDNDPKLGTVIGRAIENFEGHDGVIEILIGRM